MHFIHFTSKDANHHISNISYEDNSIITVSEIKFLGVNINNTVSWTLHVEKILPKLSSACFAMKSIKPFVSVKMLKIIYFSYFHSIMSYGIIFWGNSSASVKAFRIQKRIIRTMMGSKNRDSCRPLFKSLGILPLPSMHIFALLRFVTQNRDHFVTNRNFIKSNNHTNVILMNIPF